MKQTTLFICSNCGAQFTKWIGRCLECGKWGTIGKEPVPSASRSGADSSAVAPAQLSSLTDIKHETMQRLKLSQSEVGRVFGGGIVPGSLTLLGGEPGIGKSTLALQLALALPHSLYFSGEESVQQVKLRADRLGVPPATLRLAAESNVETIIATLKKERPPVAIIDSIQTISSNEVEGEPGAMTQVRACTTKLLEVAKQNTIALIIIGHVTKEGSVAGPKTLEHLVDTVLYVEGERRGHYRLLRAVKNRFGATDEVAVLEMTGTGLSEVSNPSAALLAERGEHVPGSILTCLMEGTRPLLVEVQALVTRTGFGYPVRKASGFDLNRLHVLIAVLQKRAGLQLEQYDVHINVVGGIDAAEPGADLAVALAVASAYKDKPAGADLVAMGEVGLGGEIRAVAQLEKRLKECELLGIKRVITRLPTKSPTSKNVKLIGVTNIKELITLA